MALVSRHKAILDKIAGILLADADLAHYNWRVRKRAYTTGAKWEPGGYVVPGPRRSPYHENQLDELLFDCWVVIVDPADGDLVEDMEPHTASLERVESIFANKAHGFMPAGLVALNADARFAVGQPAEMSVQYCNVATGAIFDPSAFDKHYDVSGVTVTVAALVRRYDATQLGS